MTQTNYWNNKVYKAIEWYVIYVQVDNIQHNLTCYQLNCLNANLQNLSHCTKLIIALILLFIYDYVTNIQTYEINLCNVLFVNVNNTNVIKFYYQYIKPLIMLAS